LRYAIAEVCLRWSGLWPWVRSASWRLWPSACGFWQPRSIVPMQSKLSLYCTKHPSTRKRCLPISFWMRFCAGHSGRPGTALCEILSRRFRFKTVRFAVLAQALFARMRRALLPFIMVPNLGFWPTLAGVVWILSTNLSALHRAKPLWPSVPLRPFLT